RLCSLLSHAPPAIPKARGKLRPLYRACSRSLRAKAAICLLVAWRVAMKAKTPAMSAAPPPMKLPQSVSNLYQVRSGGHPMSKGPLPSMMPSAEAVFDKGDFCQAGAVASFATVFGRQYFSSRCDRPRQALESHWL